MLLQRIGQLAIGILALCFFAGPLLPLLASTITYLGEWPQLPMELRWDSWSYVLFQHPHTWEAIAQSLFISLVVVAINLLFALPYGYAVTRYAFRFAPILSLITIAPIIIPAFVPLMGLQLFFISLNLIDSLTGVILAHILPTLPYMVHALIIGYRATPVKWEVQAQLLGATSFQSFVYVIWPSLLPAVASGVILCFLISFSQYITTLIIGGGMVTTLPLVMLPYLNGGDGMTGSIYATLFVIFSLLSLFLLQKLLHFYYRKQGKGALNF
jgi:putative spermidine/putrescine transport system permease protein